MRKTAAVIIFAAFAFAALADTNTVEELEHIRYHMEQAREMYRDFLKEFRRLQREYDEACLKAGITNSRPKAASSSATIFTKSQAAFFENRRIAVSRDTTTIPGAVITTWYRNGKPDTKAPAVVTNYLHTIVGAEQKNPIQELAERMRQRAEQWQLVAKELEVVATNNAMRVDRVAHALDERRAEYVEKRDAAVLPTTKAIYQAFIDAIDRLKEKLAEGGV